MIWNRWIAAVMLLGSAALMPDQARAQTPATFSDGQGVEVREGDVWSAATVVRREGRRYLIRYEGADSSEEWVTSDRLRVRGASAETTPAAAPKPAPRAEVFVVGQKIEVKWGGTWYPSTIVRKQGEWTLIDYEGWRQREWVEPWRMRRLGSTEDKYGHASPNPTVTRNEPPPRPTPGAPPRARGSAEADAEARQAEDAVAPVKQVDRDSAQERILSGDGNGDFAPDAASEIAQKFGSQPIGLKASGGGAFEETSLFMPGKTAIAVHVDRTPGRSYTTRLERIDLSAGNTATMDMPLPFQPSDLSDDGKLLLGHSTAFGFGTSDRLDLWQVDGKAPVHVVSFRPYDNEQHAARDVQWAGLIDADRALTINSSGRLIAWDLRNARALWAADASRGRPALSAGRKYLALGHDNSLFILDASGGNVVKRIDAGPLHNATLSFSPDGKMLAAADQDLLLIWDIASGKLIHDLSPVGAAGRRIDWLSDGFVLLDGEFLVAPEKMQTVWRYSTAGRNRVAEGAMFAGRWWYVTTTRTGSSGRPVLASVAMPTPEGKAAVAKVNADSLLLQPGSKISLEISLPGEIQDQAVQAIRQQLAANGVTVEDGAAVKLVANVTAGESKEIAYRRFGESPFAEGTKVTATPQISRVAIIDSDGKTAWERKTSTGTPSFLSLKEGQSIESAVADATRPRVEFFKNMRVPKFVPKPAVAQGFGVTQLTAVGPVLQKPR